MRKVLEWLVIILSLLLFSMAYTYVTEDDFRELVKGWASQ
jgi:hypothetical protein